MITYRVLLPHPLEPRLLMLQSHGEWRLPQWHDATDPPWQNVDHINRAVAARFGAETTVLRCVHNEPDPASREISRVYELENHSPVHDLPLPVSWIGQYDLPHISIPDAAVREAVQDWFARQSGAVPQRGAPWTRRGWYVQALSWTVARLRDRGIAPHGTPDQLRVSERCFLLRVHTDVGTCFLKASPSRCEPALAVWLALRQPERSQEVIEADGDRNWLLLNEVPGVVLPLEEVREEPVWEDAVRALAELQVESVRHAEELESLGCPNRGLEVLARRIPALVRDAQAMLLGEECGLSRAQIETLAALGPTLLSLCEELAHFGIPNALEHGNLVARRILVTMKGPVFMDWTDASISHPFFSAFQLVRDAERMLPDSSGETRRRIRDAYLQPWTSIAPADVLARAFDIARILAPVHHAATAHAEILPATGYRWEVECTVPSHLRHALQLLEENV